MLKTLWVLASFAVIWVSGQNAARWASLVDADNYFIKIMNAMVTEIEENHGWWNLKLLDVGQTLDEQMYNWHVVGTVNYTNGFVVSVEKIELSNIGKSVNQLRNSTEWTGSVSGNLILSNVKVGFDVIVNLNGKPVQHYTGTYTHSQIGITCRIMKNINQNQYDVTATVLNLNAGTGVRMIYMPVNNVTQVLARRYLPASNWDSIKSWCSNVIQPILLKLTEKIDFPNVCFACTN